MNLLGKIAAVIIALGSMAVAQADPITIDFDGIAANAGGDEPGTFLTDQFESDGIVFDIDGLLLGSVSRTGSSGILAISLSDIYSFTFSHVNGGFNGIDDILGFDNLRFNTVAIPSPPPTPVPEPGTLALFTIGLAGIGLARRRKA